MFIRTLKQCKEFRARLDREMMCRHEGGELPLRYDYRDNNKFCVMGLVFNQMVKEEPEKFYWQDRIPHVSSDICWNITSIVKKIIPLYLGITEEQVDYLVETNDNSNEVIDWVIMAEEISNFGYTQEATT